jgi:hypothetical protein
VAVAKLSRPLLKDVTKEALVRVKCFYASICELIY